VSFKWKILFPVSDVELYIFPFGGNAQIYMGDTNIEMSFTDGLLIFVLTKGGKHRK
jgi:hypothetical protein